MSNSKVVMIIRESDKDEVFDELGDIMDENDMKYEIVDDAIFEHIIDKYIGV